ncbi:MAG: hypothetical protein KAH32_08120 [Chlamydiia bacterium]|nr:hypothetical protein [Chlamydiia bacterium]
MENMNVQPPQQGQANQPGDAKEFSREERDSIINRARGLQEYMSKQDQEKGIEKNTEKMIEMLVQRVMAIEKAVGMDKEIGQGSTGAGEDQNDPMNNPVKVPPQQQQQGIGQQLEQALAQRGGQQAPQQM